MKFVGPTFMNGMGDLDLGDGWTVWYGPASVTLNFEYLGQLKKCVRLSDSSDTSIANGITEFLEKKGDV
jgi:hypothetical protein